jgi:hypothetical protein
MVVRALIAVKGTGRATSEGSSGGVEGDQGSGSDRAKSVGVTHIMFD